MMGIKFFEQLSIQKIFGLAFILQVLTPVGIVSYLSWQNTEQSIDQLADQFMYRISDRVMGYLKNSMLDANVILQNNTNALQNNYIRVDNLKNWRPHLFKQTKLSDKIAYVYFGKTNGEYVEVAQRKDIEPVNLTYRLVSPNQIGQQKYYQLQSNGEIGRFISSNNYDPRIRPWYQLGQRANQPTWTNVYQFIENPKVLGVSLVQSHYDNQNRFQGVLGVDFTLFNLNQILQSFNPLPSGQIFIMEKDGNLIATSSDQLPYDAQNRRIKANQLQNPILKTIAQKLETVDASANELFSSSIPNQNSSQTLKLKLNENLYYVRVLKIQDPQGLDWRLVVAIPQTDLMQQVWQNRNQTAILIGAVTLGVLAISYWIGRWIAHPIAQLSRASQHIAAGEFKPGVTVQAYNSYEVNQLTQRFSHMCEELQKNQRALQQQADSLEEKVKIRSEEMQAEISARKQTNLRLESTLNQLQSTQDQLVRSAKLAALGELLAAVAHEMSAPLNQIQFVASRLEKDLPQDFSQLPKLVQEIPETLHPAFFQMFQQALQAKCSATQVNYILEVPSIDAQQLQPTTTQPITPQPITTQQTITTQQWKAIVVEQLQTAQVLNSQSIAEKIVHWGFKASWMTEQLPNFMPLLKDPQGRELIELIDNLSTCASRLSTIDTATDAAAKVVEALRSYSHRSHDQTMVEISIVDNIETAVTLYNHRVRDNITLNRLYQPVPKILGAPDELAQVWTNLLQNALYAMKQAGVLTIQVLNQVHLQSIQIKISDTGVGISAEIQDHVFEPFFTTKPSGEGNGLGLSIVKRIIEQHQGSITFTSQPGYTEFTVTLPYSQNVRSDFASIQSEHHSFDPRS